MLLDTYSWVEFLIGSSLGLKVMGTIKTKKCFTSVATLAEITNFCLRNSFRVEETVTRIKRLSKVLDINDEIAELAGKINFENKKDIKNLGMVDSLIYATALIYNLTVLTGDNHFKNLRNVEML